MIPAEQSGRTAGTHGDGADVMPTTLKTTAESYLRTKALSRATRNEYLSTLRKWEKWGGGIGTEATTCLLLLIGSYGTPRLVPWLTCP